MVVSGDPSKTVFDLLSNPLPEIEFLPEEEFLAATQEVHETPFDDKFLEYEVRLPKDWVKKTTADISNLGVNQDVLGEIAAYVSPPRLEDARSEFKVQSLSLSYDIAASHWFLQHVLSNAYNLEGIKEHNERRVEAVYVVVRDDTTFVVRAVAIKNGKRIILAEFFVPQGQWQDERVLAAQGMSSFDLMNTDKSYVQKIKNYKFLDIAEFSYPDRWELRTPTIKTTERMQARLLNANRDLKILNGQIEIYVVSAGVVESLEDELLNFKKILTQKGLQLGKLIDVSQDFGFDESMKFGVVESYVATNDDKNLLEYELWLAVMASESYYYFIPMVTPMRTEDFMNWSRNVGDFRIVVANTKPIVDKPGMESE
ncbi:MAG: hypothetical protein LRZ85_01855 [Alphaproteobacteria bacterium]|nr:hypothetical protein [Alphaproteobacteria bacterium]